MARRRRSGLAFLVFAAACVLLHPRTGPGLRRRVKERLFGREDTFDYEG